MEKSTEVKEYIQKCLQEALDKMMNEPIGHVIDTTGLIVRKWVE